MFSYFSFEQAKGAWDAFSKKYEVLEQEIASKVPQVLTVPVDENKSNILKNVLEKGDWKDPIFDDENTPYAALALYRSKQITYHQLCTVLERRQNFQDFPLINTYPILDENNEFTNEAREILLPVINQSEILKKLTNEQELELKQLVLALPLSERFFYTTSQEKFKDEEDVSLGNTVISNNICALMKNKESGILVHLSTGVFDAVGLVRFGLDEYIRPLYRFGAQVIDDIESGVRQYARIAALGFPGTKSFAGNIHDYENTTEAEATAHDRYHAYVMSALPKSLLSVFWYMVDISRSATKNKWSKEIWTFIDCEMNYSINNYMGKKSNQISDKEMTELFCNSIKMNNGGFSEKYSFLVLKNEMTPVFITFILDTYKHQDIWKKYGIDPQYFIDKFKESYDAIGKIYSQIKDDDYNMQLFKCQLYLSHLSLGEGAVVKFDEILEEINKDKENISKQILLKRVISKDIEQGNFLSNRRNAFYLSYGNIKTPEKIYDALVKYFISEGKIIPSIKKKPQARNYGNNSSSVMWGNGGSGRTFSSNNYNYKN